MPLSSYFGLLVCFYFAISSVAYAEPEYQGSEVCASCHKEIYANWADSGHHLQLQKATEAQKRGLPLPESYEWADISYVIGGVNTKAYFVNQDGYIITTTKDGHPSQTQYNLNDQTWTLYRAGEKVPYDCAACHTTGYSPAGHQGGRSGIEGTWREDGIGCEECHGPGGDHVKNTGKSYLRKIRSNLLCEQCHQHGGIDKRSLIDVGLPRHHEKIHELKSGTHKGLSCVNCHDPHKKASLTRNNCVICHSKDATNYEAGIHGQVGIQCIECHMVKIPMSAISNASYIGNVRSHLFSIEANPNKMFQIIEEKGRRSKFTKDSICVAFACLSCHNNQDHEWALNNAKDFHSLSPLGGKE